ncbi:SAM-dependent methyltransferase [Bacillus coahuilensis m2-6]|uniref:SAM-dependent methyltransferase n=1 Tax=Bacillus coahuilensis p1.1.43 TaxID=1150625 RepID=A0A147K7F8_9BACI|nr:tRNA (adenine(22)-N(1))-methyltransferase TrmK [Bacillus coahuilensis]KUP06009.1 SAM-dependent methyltransferase [Bacillus coahuilensis p1.1.43]KUP07221.1 SAM-dependent methyltransferase [Bacillus coahuilensis m2-6]
MNQEKLSLRLEKVTNYIRKGSKLADIGSDHAYLPCYCIQHEICSFAVAGEVVKGPFESALKQVKSVGLEDKIDVRFGSGLEVIEPGEVDCITIAGMGGTLIATILEEGKGKLVGKERLILQPNISAISIRKWLYSNGWEIIYEEIVEEDGKIYEIVVAEKGNQDAPYEELEKEWLFGPFLLKEKSSIFKSKWMHESNQWRKILQALENADETEEVKRKRLELMQKIQWTEELFS